MSQSGEESLFGEALATIDFDTDLTAWLIGLDANHLQAVARAYQPKAAATAFSAAIQTCLDEGRPQEADNLLVAWEQGVDPSDVPEIKADLKYWRGEVDVVLGRHASAGEAFEAAASSTSDPRKRNMALANAGHAWTLHGDLSRAEQAYSSARDESAAGRGPEGSIRAMLGLAGIAAARGDASQAIDLLEDAQDVEDETVGGVLRAQLFMEIGVRYAASGLLDFAARSYEKARAALDKVPPVGNGDAGLRDRFLLALDANARSLNIRLGQAPASTQPSARANPSGSEEAIDRLIDARELFAAGNVEAARERAFDALEQAESAGFRDGRLQSRLLISLILGAQGFYEPALRFAAEAVDDLEALRAMAGTADDRIGFAASRNDIYGMAVDLCRVMNELSGDNAFLERGLIFIEGAKSRALSEMLAGVASSPPAALPTSLIDTGAPLLEPAGPGSPEAAAGPQTVKTGISPDKGSIRTGQRFSSEDCKALLADLAAGS